MTFKRSLWISLLLIGIIPLISLGAICTAISMKNLEKRGETHLLSAAETSGVCFESYLKGQIQEVSLMGKTNRIQRCLRDLEEGSLTEMVQKESNEALYNWLNENDSYLNAYALDSNGVVFSCFDGEHIGMDFSEQPFFEQMFLTDGIYISSVTKSFFDKRKEIIRFGGRIEYDGHEGIIVLETALDFYDLVIDKNLMGFTGSSFIIDENEHLVCSTDNYLRPEEYKGYEIASLLGKYKSGEIEKSGVGYYTYNDRRIIMSYYVIEKLGWVFLTTQEYSELNEPVYVLLRTMLIVIALVLMAVIFTCTFLTKLFMMPVIKLQEVFKKAAMEERYVFCEVTGKNEFGELAEGYNIMISRLDQQHQKLDELYQEVRSQEEEIRQSYMLLNEEHQKIEQLTLRDFLTGLDNRASFEGKLRLAMSEGDPAALIFLDMDGFKAINDVYGHGFGDLCVLEVAKRLGSLPEIIARVGGDEFYVLKQGNREEIENLITRINQMMEEPFFVNEIAIHMTVSIGVAIYPEDGDDMVSLMKSADIAMYRAKGLGKNQICFFKPDMLARLERHMDILGIIHEVIEQQEVFAVFQPQISFPDGQIYGFEALMRIVSKEIGFISPVEFIPISETSGDIIPLGRWILKRACLVAKKLLDEGRMLQVMSVNVSLIQLDDLNFVSLVLEVLEETGLPPHYLQLEISESVFMEHLEKNIEKLHELRTHGVTIALDDFGTGYSVMNYLFELPIDILKIDKLFMDDIINNPNKQTVCRYIIEMAHTLGMKVIAEGIEYKEQKEMLIDMGCDLIQGYFYGHPVSEADTFALFNKLF